jgi:Holliday junction resolvase RusA-like endonuclease
MIAFTVPGIPVAQPRQRHRIIQAHDGRQFVGNYTPAKDPVNSFKAVCRLAASQVYQGAPLDEPIELKIVAVFPRPKGKIWKSKPMPREYKGSKPDFDNLGKSICDALNEVVWRDDSLVVDAHIVKCIAAGDEQPHVEIKINPIGWVWKELQF